MATTGETLFAELTLAIEAGTPVVHRVLGRDQMSQPFRYEVDFSAHELPLDELRGTLASVTLRGGGLPEGHERNIHGLVTEAEITPIHSDGYLLVETFRYQIVLTPVHATLAYNHGFRVFQQLSVIEICSRVMSAAGIATDAIRYATGSYAKRDLCVQYDESEWDFLCRLFEEEGIWFCFEHSAESHVMVVGDDSQNAARIDPDLVELRFAGPLGDDLKATEFTLAQEVSVAKAAIKDTDSLQPSLDLYAEAELNEAPLAREFYDYPSRVLDPSRTDEMAQRRLDAETWRRELACLRTNAVHAEAGRLLTLDRGRDGASDFLITTVDLDLRFVSTGTAEDGGAICEAELELLRAEQAFRPLRRTRRPRIAGVQTARVTGPEGEEIHTDVHGRVKLQFPWDRDGQLDDKSSCWVRVQQAHTTGSYLVPRVGWEVLVEFEEGDPDRPLCLGRVYNPFFPPPFALPAQKTVSAHRSYSTPGGGGVNEISMDDAGGAELLKVFGQTDIHVVAANNRARMVAQHETATVALKRAVHIGANETVVVRANLSESVASDHAIHVGGNRRTTIDGGASEEIAGNVTASIGALHFLHVGNTAQAVVDSVLSDAVSTCQSAAAGLLAPIQAQVTQAQDALGNLAAMGGAFGAAVGIHAAAATDAATDAVVSVAVNAVSGGRGGSAASASGPAGAAGNGSWATEVGADVTETVGGLVLCASLKGMSMGVGGNSTETIAAARVEKIGGGKSEVTAESKLETLGSYKVEAREGIKVDAGGSATITIKGKLEQNIGEGHAVVSGAKATLKTKTLALDAKTSITFECGLAKLVVNSKGVALSGLQVTLDGKQIELKPAAIKPG